ncbi:MAG: dihydroneopterin aldolase [Rickettsiales bacterium]|nr:dihydroneopterin aldolase [Rickettsiales bacterium]
MEKVKKFEKNTDCKLIISKLSLPVYLGCHDYERKEKQNVLVTIEISFKNIPIGVNTDQLEDTICYSMLVEHIQKFVENKKFNLIEKFAKDIHKCVYMFLATLHYPVSLIKVIVHKKVASIPAIKGGVFFTYDGDEL